MDIQIKRCEGRLAYMTIAENSSAHIDYFHADGSVELTINNVLSITHDKGNDLYNILSRNGHSVDIPYMSYYQIVIC